MSGGVDSTASALLLQQQYDVHGFFMKLAQPNLAELEDRVRTIAGRISLPLTIVDLQQEFTQHVLRYFSTSYFRGETPNPCMICNREIKFGLFLQTIIAHGMKKMATGHYCRILEENGSYKLLKGSDPKKDQTYFLARLSQEQLSRALFPLGEFSKEETYRFVEQLGFTEFRGLESQDVCFLEQGQVGDFLAGQSQESNRPGPILTQDGKILGQHQGIYRYTIGQRRGLGIAAEAPLYVVRLDVTRNAVIVGRNEDLLQTEITLSDLFWISGKIPELDKEYSVRIRYTHPGAPARLSLNGTSAKLTFQQPQRAITPGQFAVFYDGDELLGSGIIG